MGADQSLPATEVTRKLTDDGPSSLPASPGRSTLLNGSFCELGESGKSFSTPVVGSAPFMSFISETLSVDPHHHGSKLTRASSESHCAPPNLRDNTSTRPFANSPTPSSTGIVVVSSRLLTNFISSSSVDINVPDSNTDPSVAEIRRLRRLPVFHPLIPNTSTAKFTLTNAGRVYRPSLAQLDPIHLVHIINCFREHLGTLLDAVERNQVVLVGLQNKIDYEVAGLMEFLQSREQGIPPAFRRLHSDGGNAPDDVTHSSAGKKQVDTIILETSQISGMISQCNTLVNQLSVSLQQINGTLPKEKRLPPFNTNLTN